MVNGASPRRRRSFVSHVKADEGLAWLELREALRPEDTVIAVTPCTEQLFVIETNGYLDMGESVEEAQSWAEVSLSA